MRQLVMSAVLLLNGTLAAGNCTVVEVLSFQPSSQNARIAVSINGKPQKDVNVVLSSYDGQARLTTATDSEGVVNLPDLPPGKYCLAASVSPTLRADVCLEVAKNRGRKPSAFSMELRPSPPPPPSFEEELEAAEKAPITVRIQVFAIIVEDPSTAFVPGTKVAVYRRGLAERAHPLESTTDEQGRFTAPLPPGIYTAVFQISGFQTEFVSFEIAPDGSKEELRVKLKLAMCT